MSETAISIRLEPVKGATEYAGQQQHDHRKGRTPRYVDASKSHLNTIPIPLPSFDDALERIRVIKKNVGARQKFNPHKNRIAFRGIVTFSNAAKGIVQDLTPDEQDRRFLETAQAIAKEHGTEVTGLAVHRDETAPHAHFFISGIGNNGKSLRIDFKACERLQDIGAAPWSDMGITRGKRKEARKADGEPAAKRIHRNVKRLHEDLPLEIAQKEQELAALQAELERQVKEKAELDAQAQAERDHLLAECESLRAVARELEQRKTGMDERIESQRLELERIKSEIEQAKGEDYENKLEAVAAFADFMLEHFAQDIETELVMEALRATIDTCRDFPAPKIKAALEDYLPTVSGDLDKIRIRQKKPMDGPKQ